MAFPASKPQPTPQVEWLASTAPVPYPDALAVMDARAAAIARGEAQDCVWLLEHPSIYTAGTSADPAELLDARPLSGLQDRPRRALHLSRPGPARGLCDARPRPARPRRAGLVTSLEDWLIATLARLGVEGERRPGQIGIFVGKAPSSPASACACATGSRCMA